MLLRVCEKTLFDFLLWRRRFLGDSVGNSPHNGGPSRERTSALGVTSSIVTISAAIAQQKTHHNYTDLDVNVQARQLHYSDNARAFRGCIAVKSLGAFSQI